MLPSMFAQAHGAIAGIGNFAPVSLLGRSRTVWAFSDLRTKYTFRKLFELVRKANVSNDSQDLVNAQQLQTLVAEGDYQVSRATTDKHGFKPYLYIRPDYQAPHPRCETYSARPSRVRWSSAAASPDGG
jgi:hypothetical protein